MILVTGATGLLGGFVLKQLKEDGYQDIRIFVQPGENISQIKDLYSEVVYGDITHVEEVSRAVSDCQMVIHLAGIISLSSKGKKRIFDVNVGGTSNVVNACLKHHVQKLVYVSSIHTLAEVNGKFVMRLDTQLKTQRGAYAASKIQATLEVFRGVQEGLNATVLYPSGIIGPSDYAASFISQAITYYTTGEGTKFYFDGGYYFVDVRDIAKAISSSLTKSEKGEGIVVAGNYMSLSEIIQNLQKIYGKPKKLYKLPMFFAYCAAILYPIIHLFTNKLPMFTLYSISVLKSKAKYEAEESLKKVLPTVTPISKTLQDFFRRKTVQKA